MRATLIGAAAESATRPGSTAWADPLAGFPVLGSIEVRAELYPEGLPADAYACELVGECLRPYAYAGDRAIASPSAPLQEGRLVLLWPKEGQASIKRLVLSPPAEWQAWRSGDVEPVVVVEMLNPFHRFTVRTATLVAVHAVLDIQIRRARLRSRGAADPLRRRR